MCSRIDNLNFIFLAILITIGIAAADYSYRGTNSDDRIYFGYCDSCYNGGPGLQIYRVTDGVGSAYTNVSMDNGQLLIRGLNGNDHIEAINKKTVGGYDFGDNNLLTYSRISIFGGGGDDEIFGTLKDDYIWGGLGKDHLEGKEGNDSLYGNVGDDFLSGWPGEDELYGGSGDDFLVGDQGNDRLFGDSGDDILVGGIGSDVINGGSGQDTFRCRSAVSAIPLYDDHEAVTDCEEALLAEIEVTQQRDPYREWAYMTEHRNQILYHYLTTSNPLLLLEDRAGGASILMSSGGDIPISGDFDRDGRSDNVAVFRPADRTWYYDYNHDVTTDEAIGRWGLSGDRPIAGDFDRDGKNDDVAVFRPADRTWYYDYNHDGSTDKSRGPCWAIAGDIPVAGDFDRDGKNDDVAVFRPADRTWYYDYNHDGSVDERKSPWAIAGDIPVAGDFDRDGRNDDVAVFRPADRTWYYDYNHDGSTDDRKGPWAIAGDIPVAGDFDRDGRNDDVAVFRPADRTWYYDYNHDGSTDDRKGPWGLMGEPLHTTHKQYPATCGPASLSIVMEHLGLANHSRKLYCPRDLDMRYVPLDRSVWIAGRAIDVGYLLSMEHIMYEGYRRLRDLDSNWGSGDDDFMTSDGQLNTSDQPGDCTGSFYEIKYDIGNVNWNPTTSTTSGRVQKWTHNGKAVGWSTGNVEEGLPFVANNFGSIPDAMPVSTKIGRSEKFVSMDHLKAVIKGFVDHDIPLVAGVENGGHFNTIIGYWDRGSEFYVYTADPLDGWGRPFYQKPMRWRKILLRPEMLADKAGVINSIMLYGHARSGCSGRDAWAKEIDSEFGKNTLCGYI